MRIVAVNVLDGVEAESIYSNRMKILARLDVFAEASKVSSFSSNPFCWLLFPRSRVIFRLQVQAAKIHLNIR